MSDALGRALKGVTVLVTRPAAQAEKLAAMIEAEGGTPLRMPLFAVEPVVNAAAARERLAAGHDIWIFTSANAVRHAAPFIEGQRPGLVAAVGPATAAALAGAGDISEPRAGSTSEDLLALDAFSDVRGKRILVVAGEGGRRVLERELSSRGAAVERAEVYRRVPLPHPPEAVAANLRRARIVVATSGGAVERLLQLVPEDSRTSLLRKRLVLPSARVVEMAKGFGFSRTFAVEGPMSDAALCAACVAARDSK